MCTKLTLIKPYIKKKNIIFAVEKANKLNKLMTK